MAGNSFGKLFIITTFGESHGKAIGVVIDGCPSGIEIDIRYIQNEVDKRSPGKSNLSTSRKEPDKVNIISGVFEGKSTGAPLTILISNVGQKPSDYEGFEGKYRPSHADYTYQMKYGIRDHLGGGRASARETVARVAAGAIAKLILKKESVKIYTYVEQIGSIKINTKSSKLNLEQIDINEVRCPDINAANQMINLINQVRKDGDSIGGVVSCVIQNCPIGLGEPVFDKLEADLAKAMLSINASKGFEIGSGFRSAEMKGSEHNDLFFKNENGKIATKTNNAGGILGGISNGQSIYFRIPFKPTASISKGNKAINDAGDEVEIVIDKMRHDPCVVPRAVPIVEAMAALVLADHILRNRNAKH